VRRVITKRGEEAPWTDANNEEKDDAISPIMLHFTYGTFLEK